MDYRVLRLLSLSIFLTVASFSTSLTFAENCVPSDGSVELAQTLTQDSLQASVKLLDCRSAFLNSLKKSDPDGFQIWNSLSESSKDQLKDLIVCGIDGTVSSTDLSTLVHESIHFADAQKSNPNPGSRAFLTTNGQWVSYQEDSQAWSYEHSRGQALKMMSLQERQTKRSKTYLYDIGSESFGLLLEEMNAYTIGLRTSLRSPKVIGNNTRDGPIEMVVFSIRYLEAMKKQSQNYYGSLFANKDFMKTVRVLVRDAYEMYNQSCERTDLNMDDQRSIQALRTDSSREVLTSLYGQNIPEISPRCLATAKMAENQEITPVKFPDKDEKTPEFQNMDWRGK